MTRYTKEQRQQIIRDYAEQNGGAFDAPGFLRWVEKAGPEHPAYDWFDWNDQKAADAHRIWQSRQFASGLTVKFEIRTVHRGGFKVVQTQAPLVLSPMEARSHGGGYIVTDPGNADHMTELCKQAADDLRWFLNRYEAALLHVGFNVQTIERAQSALEHVAEHQEAA